MRFKDALIALAVVAVVAVICYGLAISRPPFPPTPSHPFSTAAVGPTPEGRVVLRVNGEPITESEFASALKLFPEEMQRQFTSEAGKVALAEQLVRMKLLEQEARRMGLEQDSRIAGQLAAQRTDVLADAAAERISAPPTEAAIQQFYNENKARFETIDLSHILIAYAGGSAPPRGGGQPPSEQEAMKKAYDIYAKLRQGADFAALARQVSDDRVSAANGGKLGPVAHGMLPQELEARVFALPTGQISGPMPSQFGIHIFKVNGRGTRPLDAQLHEAIAQRVRQQHMFDRVEVMRRAATIQFDEKFFPDARNWALGKRKS